MGVIRVQVELKRIQTYLFAVPRLRTILGANALLGETLRIRLPEAAGRSAASWPSEVERPKGLDRWRCELLAARDFGGNLSTTPQGWIEDAAGASWDRGVLTRDGGHFQALYKTDAEARAFELRARQIVERKLPGVLASFQIHEWVLDTGSESGQWRAIQRDEPAFLQALFELPGQQHCEWTGRGPGSSQLKISKYQTVHVAPLVKAQWQAGTRFRKGRSYDLIGLLLHARDAQGAHVLPCRGDGWTLPEDLTQLAGGKGHYLALVHMDGNRVGKRAPVVPVDEFGNPMPQSLQQWLDSESRVEAFFASMRQQVRQALVTALRATFAKVTSGVMPYQLLMLGGDDLLIACRAEFALRFVVHYAKALKSLQLSDDLPLDVGAGVAIAQPSFPFHALHALAEELASSAKRLSRACEGQSVVDWLVVTQAAVSDPAAHRRQHEWLAYRVAKKGAPEEVATHARPYFVLDEDSRAHSEDKPSLERLVATADALRATRPTNGGDAARSQLKQLPSALRAGQRSGRLAFDALPWAIREVLLNNGIDQPWRSANLASTPQQRWYSVLPDLVEVSEIPDLGRGGASRPKDGEDAKPREASA